MDAAKCPYGPHMVPYGIHIHIPVHLAENLQNARAFCSPPTHKQHEIKVPQNATGPNL